MDEYISRDATVKAFCEKCKGYYDGHCVHRGECDIDVIQTAPAADVQPAPKWISVKERLPEIGKSVLIYYPKWDGDEIQTAKLKGDGMMFDICGEFNIRVGAVTHWMPLPEPPKDGDTK